MEKAPEDTGKMKVEIWSDMMCPFCYIGKRKFEKALDRFAHKDGVEVSWRSFQLDPGLRTQPGKSVNQYLSERKGWSLEHAREMNAHVTRLAGAVGLDYDFDKAVVANSFDAHRVVQLARTRGLDGQVEERLFRAYFTEGRDISDHATLIELGAEAGLDGEEVRATLAGDDFAAEVKQDLLEARRIGVTGVPFFVLDRKYAVSGAQDTPTFLKVLEQTFNERGPAA